MQSQVGRSSSLIIGGDSECLRDEQSDASYSSEASPPPRHLGHVEHQPLYQLPTSPSVMNFITDLPDSPISTSSTSSSSHDISSCDDSSIASSTDTSAESASSIQSQPGQQKVSSPTKHPEEEECQSCCPVLSAVSGHKLVIDNVDSTVKPRDQRIDAQTKSLHYVQVFAVKDRIDYSRLSPSPPPAGQSVYSLIPSSSDYEALKENFDLRKLIEHIPFFSEDFKELVQAHIPHKYSLEMTKNLMS